VCCTALLDPVRRWLVARHLPPLTRAQWGMCLAHFGVGLFVLGATVTSVYSIERDFSARPGDRLTAGDYEFVFRGLRDVAGPNFDAVEAEFELRRDGALVSVLRPQQRTYRVQTQPMPEAAILSGLHRDVLATLGQPLGADAWSVRVQVKPLIRFVWLGALVMALGGLLAVTDRRYRQPVREPAAVPARAAVAAEPRS
jgi:cytochrome c-type biogenesis protein CcmF